MGMDAVEQIIRGIQVGQRKNAADVEANQRQQQIDSEVEARKEAIDYHKKELENQNKHTQAVIDYQNANLELARKAAAIQTQVHQQNIAQYLRSGGEMPGDIKTPVGSGTGGAAFSPINQSDATSIQHSVPMPDGPPMQVTLPTEQTDATNKANLARILGKPAEEAKTREQQALQDAETTRQVRVAQETGAQRLKEIQEQKDWDMKRYKMTQDAENARNFATNAMHLQIAKLNLTGGLNADGTGGGFPAAAIADNVYNGKISEEQLKKMYPKQATAIASAVQSGNG